MKKILGVILAAIVLSLSGPLLADAGSASRGRAGARAHPGSREHRQSGAHREFRGHPGVHERHEAFGHRGFHGHSGTSVFIGSGFWWGPDWWGPAYPYYAEPPVIVPPAPPVVIQPAPQPQYYWYYCPNPSGYYPYIQQCPSQWLTVVPPSSTPVQ
jgi:hypothetical protein